MSPEAWAFFTTNSGLLIGIAKQSINNRQKIERKIDDKTAPVSNGTIPKLSRDIAEVKELVVNINTRVTNLEAASNGQ